MKFGLCGRVEGIEQPSTEHHATCQNLVDLGILNQGDLDLCVHTQKVEARRADGTLR